MVTWSCERCLQPCVASKAHQRGCAQYRILSPEWQARALREAAAARARAAEPQGALI